ncbi:MAG: glycosyltransferase family 2 protein [Candidatus Woesearchaeota archaeon]
MKLSIIIRVKDDLRVARCLDSIDEDVEVVVVLNTPSKEVIELLKKYNVVTTKINNNNLAKAHNRGIEVSKYEFVLLMDSDCVFKKGTINKLYQGLKSADLSKGRVLFNHSSFISKTIALSREYHVTDIENAYSPPLAFKKGIDKYIGKYYFDEDIFWTEDHEFDQRVKKAKLKINYNKKAIIYHDELSITSDLRSAHNYGSGYFEGIKKGAIKGCFLYGGNKKILLAVGLDFIRLLCLPFFFLSVLIKKNIFVASYMIIWMVVFNLGYYRQMMFNHLNVGGKK